MASRPNSIIHQIDQAIICRATSACHRLVEGTLVAVDMITETEDGCFVYADGLWYEDYQMEPVFSVNQTEVDEQFN